MHKSDRAGGASNTVLSERMRVSPQGALLCPVVVPSGAGASAVGSRGSTEGGGRRSEWCCVLFRAFQIFARSVLRWSVEFRKCSAGEAVSLCFLDVVGEGLLRSCVCVRVLRRGLVVFVEVHG